jgi:hypothetical protein
MVDQVVQEEQAPEVTAHPDGRAVEAPAPQPGTGSSLAARLLPHAAAMAIFALLAIVATWPVFPQLGGFVMDKGDPLYSVWGMAWQAHAIATNPFALFDANIMYPFKGTLAFDELSFAQAVLAAPLYWLGGNPVLSHNAFLFGTFILSGYGAWLLVRELTGSWWAGLLAGAAFAFSFYRMNHLPHMTLDTTQWMPLALLAMYKLLWTGEWRWAMALAAFFTLQALSGHYLAFYTAMLLGLFVVFYFVADRRLFNRGFWLKLFAAMGMSLLFILPILVPYVLLQGGHEFKRGLFEVERFSNTLASFLAVFRGNPLYQTLLAPFRDPGPWAIERSAFPGLTVLVLGAAALFWAGRRKAATSGAVPGPSTRGSVGRHVLFFAIIAGLSALLSLGPSLQISYAPSNYDPSAIQRVIPLPYLLLHEFVPGFQSMRVVTRIGVLTALSLSALAGIGLFFLLPRLANLFKGSRYARSAVSVTAALLVLAPVVESWSVPVGMAAVGTREEVPAVYRWLGEQPHTVILEYPVAHYKRGDISVEMANLYQYYSVYHWHDMINGSTTIRPTSYSALVHETEDCFPCPRSLDALWLMGVEYVVVHLENLSGPQREEFLWRTTDPVARVAGDFTMVEDFGSDRVYRIDNPRQVGQLAEAIPQGASLLLAEPFLDPIRVGDESSFIGGGYMAALGWYLREHPQFGDARLSFGQQIAEPETDNLPEYALLWTEQAPEESGYVPQNRVWANEFVSLYKRGPGSASSSERP